MNETIKQKFESIRTAHYLVEQIEQLEAMVINNATEIRLLPLGTLCIEKRQSDNNDYQKQIDCYYETLETTLNELVC